MILENIVAEHKPAESDRGAFVRMARMFNSCHELRWRGLGYMLVDYPDVNPPVVKPDGECHSFFRIAGFRNSVGKWSRDTIGRAFNSVELPLAYYAIRYLYSNGYDVRIDPIDETDHQTGLLIRVKSSGMTAYSSFVSYEPGNWERYVLLKSLIHGFNKLFLLPRHFAYACEGAELIRGNWKYIGVRPFSVWIATRSQRLAIRVDTPLNSVAKIMSKGKDTAPWDQALAMYAAKRIRSLKP